MPVFYDRLLFGPFRLALLVFWFYLCMYLVQRFEFSPLISKKYKPLINTLMLLIGPFVLFTLIIAHAARTMEQKSISFAQAVVETFGKAIEIAAGDMESEGKRLWELTEKLKDGLQERIEYVYANSHPTQRLPGTMNLSFEFLEGESIILNLDIKGVAVSTGSACTSGSLEPSHVLTALGLPPATAQGAIRFSLGRDNVEADVDYILEELPPIVKRLRAMSPLYADKLKEKTIS